MDYRRRRILQIVAASGTVSLAGCGGPPDNTTESGSPGTESEPVSQSPPESQQAKLVADDGGENDYFGDSVALADDGSTAIVGAWLADGHSGEDAGAAYVFTRSGGSWSQETELTPDDSEFQNTLGTSVAIAGGGTLALIGAKGDGGSGGSGSGAAYVFGRSDGSWSPESKLTPDDGDYQDEFGSSVALTRDGSSAVIGAEQDADPNGEEAGSAYVFTRSGTAWSQQAKLAAEDGDSEDAFGESVAVGDGGNTVLIGARNAADPNGEEAGSAYVFTRGDGTWTQQSKLAADDSEGGDKFGYSVALAGDGQTAVVGAYWDQNRNGYDAGSAYVFTRSGGTWDQQSKLAADDGDSDDRFGLSVSLASDGSTALVGAPADEDPNGRYSGSAYLFTRDGETWNQYTKLAADDGDDDDEFGASASLTSDGSAALIGAASDEDPNVDNAGSAYVFE